MLVLSRLEHQDVIIDVPPHLCDEVRLCVRVVEIRGNRVRLGFEAPRNIQIHRREVVDRIEEELKDESEIELEEAIEKIPADLVWSRK